MAELTRIPRDVARKLGFYVYIYVNPLDNSVFYVGKGKGQRALSHLQDTSRSRKAAVMQLIRRAGKEPLIEILAHALPNAEVAFRVEAVAIDLLKLPSLVNEVRGWRSVTLGRRSLAHLVSFYRKRPVEIREPTVLIRINRLYRPDMTAAELYDATRGAWKVGPARDRVRYGFAVFEGVVREAYEIDRWLPAGSTFSTRHPRGVNAPGRWEFIGRVAPDYVRDRYVDGYVGHLFRPGAQNPIAYVNAS
jgi:hypothetical protein